MNSVIFKFDGISSEIEKRLCTFHNWLKSKYITTQPITVIFTNEIFYVNNSKEDVFVLEEKRTIYYSLNDIEAYKYPVNYYSKSISAEENMLLTILYDVCRELAIFYIGDKQHVKYGEVLKLYQHGYEIKILQQMMLYQYYFLSYCEHTDATEQLKVSFTRDIEIELKDTLKKCIEYIKLHFNIITPLEIKISSTEFDFAGQFSEPSSPFDKSVIKVTTKDYHKRIKQLGSYDAQLNICRILLHEIIHYQFWVESKWIFDIEEEENEVSKLEDKHIDQFIDEFM